MISRATPHQVAIVRVLLGLYLLVFFAYSLTASTISPIEPSYFFLPAIVPLDYSAWWFLGFSALCIVLSLSFLLGFARRTAALLLLVAWGLFAGNIIVAVLLFAFVLIPLGEPWALVKTDFEFESPVWVAKASWIFLAGLFFISGTYKILALSDIHASALTWAILFLQLSFAPLCLNSRARPYALVLLAFTEAFVLITHNSVAVSGAVLIMLVFLADSAWTLAKGPSNNITIVFFDGVCGLCNSVVDFLVAENASGRLKFASLQGETAQKNLERHQTEALETFVLYEPKRTLTKSDAAIQTAVLLGGIWNLAILLRAIPRFVRNPLYDYIAKNRYAWFGRRDTCRIPSKAEQKHFLP